MSLKGNKSYTHIVTSANQVKGSRNNAYQEHLCENVKYCSLDKCTLTADNTTNMVSVKITNPDTNINNERIWVVFTIHDASNYKEQYISESRPQFIHAP